MVRGQKKGSRPNNSKGGRKRKGHNARGPIGNQRRRRLDKDGSGTNATVTEHAALRRAELPPGHALAGPAGSDSIGGSAGDSTVAVAADQLEADATANAAAYAAVRKPGWASVLDRLNPKRDAFDFAFREQWHQLTKLERNWK